MTAYEYVRNVGLGEASEAVTAGRRYLKSRPGEKLTFTRDEVRLISELEAYHLAVEAVAAAVEEARRVRRAQWADV